VVGIDRFTDYYPESWKKNNLRNLTGNPKFEFHRGDLNTMDLGRILAGVDEVCHLAAQAGIRASWGKGFEHYTGENLLATQRLLEACKEKKLERYVFASTSSIYGESETAPTHEEVRPRPLSPYGVTKLACEQMCWLYAKYFEVPAVAVRYFSVYGPRQRPDMAFTKFLRAGLAGEPIEVYGDGEQTRDFTFVSDSVEGTIAALERGKIATAYNIGGGSWASLNRVIEIMNRLLGHLLDVTYTTTQKGDVRHTRSDNSLEKTIWISIPSWTSRRGLPSNSIG